MLSVFMKSLIWTSITLKLSGFHGWGDHYKFFCIDLENILLILKKKKSSPYNSKAFTFFNCEISLSSLLYSPCFPKISPWKSYMEKIPQAAWKFQQPKHLSSCAGIYYSVLLTHRDILPPL